MCQQHFCGVKCVCLLGPFYNQLYTPLQKLFPSVLNMLKPKYLCNHFYGLYNNWFDICLPINAKLIKAKSSFYFSWEQIFETNKALDRQRLDRTGLVPLYKGFFPPCINNIVYQIKQLVRKKFF